MEQSSSDSVDAGTDSVEAGTDSVQAGTDSVEAGSADGDSGAGDAAPEVTQDTTLESGDSARTPEGTLVESQPSGNTKVTTAEGQGVTVNKDGSVTVDNSGLTKMGLHSTETKTGEGESDVTTLTGDGTYESATGLKVTIADGKVTIVNPDGEKVIVDGEEDVEIDLPEDKDEPEDGIEDPKGEDDGKNGEDEKDEKDDAGDELPSPGGGNPGGGGGPSGGGGPTGGGGDPGGGGAGDPGAGDPGVGDQDTGGQDTETPPGSTTDNTGSTEDIEVSPDALRRDAGVWEDIRDTFTKVGEQVADLQIDQVDFGLAAVLHSGYADIQAKMAQLVSDGGGEFSAIASTLRSNARKYDDNEQEGAALSAGVGAALGAGVGASGTATVAV